MRNRIPAKLIATPPAFFPVMGSARKKKAKNIVKIGPSVPMMAVSMAEVIVMAMRKVIWGLILAVQLTNLTIEQKNLFTFCCSAVLFPVSWGLSKLLHVDFEGKGNPLSKLGLLFSLNQLLYILIVMWVYAAVPDKMVMVYAMVFGAHLMPFSWLYQSRSYLILSIVIPIVTLVAGLLLPSFVLCIIMVAVEAVFSLCLHLECKALNGNHASAGIQ